MEVQQKTQLDLQGGTIVYQSRPSPRFVFTNTNSEKPIVLVQQAIAKLLRALPGAEKATKFVADKCSEDPDKILEDGVYFTDVLATLGYTQARLECNIYQNKAYMFLKRYFKATKPYAPEVAETGNPGEGASEEERNLFLIEKRLQQNAKPASANATPDDVASYPRWVPCKGHFRLELDDLAPLRNFIYANLIDN